MSYKTVILADHPLSYYPLDDLTIVDSVLSFTDLLSQFATYQEVLDTFSSYANIYGDIAYDYSGCNNNGNYIGDPAPNTLPIVVGNSRATKITNLNSLTYNITNDYSGTTYSDHFATKYSSDADFTLECWFYPKISSSNVVTVLGDSSNNIGLFYDNGNITFNLDTKSLTHTLADIDEVMHIVAVYAVTAAYIYINGEIVAALPLSDFEFTNEQCNLESGPAFDTDHFLLNSVATYRYALSSERIMFHYEEAKGLNPVQIVYPNNGEIFKIYDNSPSLVYKYSYPGNKSWDYFTTTDLYYDQSKNTLAVKYDSNTLIKNIVLNDYITLPIAPQMDSSKIEWRATEGVTVSTSIDGTTYNQCTNGDPIPGYEIDNFSSNNQLYIRINMETTDATKYLPRIEDLIITFYANQVLYAENSSSYIKTLEGVSGVTAFNIGIGNNYSEPLWRGNKNGIRVGSNSGFYINTSNEIKTLEFFYTPSTFSDDSGLIETEDSNGYLASVYKWNNSGAITKTGISAIYVNGINKTTETQVQNVFVENDLHHVLIVYSDLVSGLLKFNHNPDGSIAAIFQNMALYPDAFTSTQAQNAYNLYRYKDYDIYNASPNMSINMTENSVNYYNNDWVVVQTA